MLTWDSHVFLVSLEVLLEVLALMDRSPDRSYELDPEARARGVRLFTDSRTGGGAWRAVWSPLDADSEQGVVWVSRHGGYPHLQEEYDLLIGLLLDAGARPVSPAEAGSDPVFGR